MHGLHPLAVAARLLPPWTRAGAIGAHNRGRQRQLPSCAPRSGFCRGRSRRWGDPRLRRPCQPRDRAADLDRPALSPARPIVLQANLRIDATRFVPNLGNLRGAVDMGAGGNGLPSRGVIELAAASMGSWTVGISAGDTALTAYSSRLPSQLAVYPVRGPAGCSTDGGAGPQRGERIRRPDEHVVRLVRRTRGGEPPGAGRRSVRQSPG